MTLTRSSGADFHPVSAVVYQPNRIQLESGEQTEGEPTVVLQSRIKTPRGMFTKEQTNQGHANSSTDNWIDIRIEGGGDLLTADMWILHQDIRYNIKGRLGVDYRLGICRYQVVMSNDYSNVPNREC